MAGLRPKQCSDAALTALLRDHCDPLLSYIQRMGVPPHDADDVLQEVLEAAYLAYERFDPARGSPRVWLLGIATRQVMNYRRRMSRRHEDLSPGESVEPADEAPSSEVRLIMKDRQDILEELLAEIPEERRCIFILHELEGHKMREIAKALSLNINTASARNQAAWRDLEAAVLRWQARQRRRGYDDVPAILVPLLEKARADGALTEAGLRLLHPDRSPPGLGPAARRRGLISGGMQRVVGPALVAAAVLFGPMDTASDRRTPMRAIDALAAHVALSLPVPAPDRPAERAPEISPPPAQVTSAAPAATPRRARAAPRPATATHEEQLRAEVKLIERAVGAIHLKQLPHARQLLEQHARQFPDGLLARQRKDLVSQVRSLEGG